MRCKTGWVGKRAAIAEAGHPTRKTLRPVRNTESVPTGADSEGNPYCNTGSVNWDTTENLYIDTATVHKYNDGDLIACFAEKISDTVVEEIAKRQPLRAVFRDSSFTSSPEKINVAEIFKLLAPNTKVKVI